MAPTLESSPPPSALSRVVRDGARERIRACICIRSLAVAVRLTTRLELAAERVLVPHSAGSDGELLNTWWGREGGMKCWDKCQAGCWSAYCSKKDGAGVFPTQSAGEWDRDTLFFMYALPTYRY
mmetsp:Transcript_13249/g.28760  ORF Transcript_13249/g.28760 Transcript_13249/m.28760 type:complete len:124 (+) Transcript_13249:1146-1517(+)